MFLLMKMKMSTQQIGVINEFNSGEKMLQLDKLSQEMVMMDHRRVNLVIQQVFQLIQRAMLSLLNIKINELLNGHNHTILKHRQEKFSAVKFVQVDPIMTKPIIFYTQLMKAQVLLLNGTLVTTNHIMFMLEFLIDQEVAQHNLINLKV